MVSPVVTRYECGSQEIFEKMQELYTDIFEPDIKEQGAPARTIPAHFGVIFIAPEKVPANEVWVTDQLGQVKRLLLRRQPRLNIPPIPDDLDMSDTEACKAWALENIPQLDYLRSFSVAPMEWPKSQEPEFKVRLDHSRYIARQPMSCLRGDHLRGNYEPSPKQKAEARRTAKPKRKSKGMRKHIRRQKAKLRKAGL